MQCIPTQERGDSLHERVDRRQTQPGTGDAPGQPARLELARTEGCRSSYIYRHPSGSYYEIIRCRVGDVIVTEVTIASSKTAAIIS